MSYLKELFKKVKFPLIICLLLSIFFVACNPEKLFVDPEKEELYKICDKFIDSLSTYYESYGLYGGLDKIKVTKKGEYKIFPMERLINIKINRQVDKDTYELLRKDIERRYKKDSRVTDVYICKGGTIMIDCNN